MIEEKKDMIAVWMGTSHKTIDEFNEYTEGLEDPDSNCPAFKDFGINFIDTDWFAAYGTVNHEIIPVEDLVKEVGTNSKKTNEQIVKAAKEKGITEGNSLYYYCLAVFHETDPNKKYNDLTFIGNFYDPYKPVKRNKMTKK
ncbi:immunity 22 family protein [Psychrobacter sp. I-STPA6b]|uniref:immunity 22 family protein n=1 Tax=Psychrobacter sp. I-STPA6b TaxID=2585718 RepID=UPI001D0C7C67|nr:immunity 22 family protein [Psychrobacter sp. I-STPA6b]